MYTKQRNNENITEVNKEELIFYETQMNERNKKAEKII